METKLFEVRDRMTFIPVLCVKLEASCEADRYLLAMSGFGLVVGEQVQYLLYAKLQEGKFDCVPHYRGDRNRTHAVAHYHINENWEKLKSGDVIDVEFILKESTSSRTPQRLSEIINP